MFSCSRCEKHFSFPGTFDDHRIGDHAKRQRTCMTTEAMIAAGYTTNTLASGVIVWRAPQPEGGYDVVFKKEGDNGAIQANAQA